MKVSVIVPCYNAAATIARQLDALAQQFTAPWEVIVVDNGSTDATVDVARTYAGRLPRFRLVRASQRRGASHARNAGTAAATGEFVAFCDADDEVSTGWIAGLQSALNDYDFVASRFDHDKLNPPTAYVHPQAMGLNCDESFRFLPHAGGCGLAVRRTLHTAAGGFDETIRYHEDTDYCWKIQLRGVAMGFAADALVHVQNRTRSVERFRQARRWAASQVVLYKRYRHLGMPRPPILTALRDWRSLAADLIRVASGGEQFDRISWRLGTRIGRLQGSLSCLVLFL